MDRRNDDGRIQWQNQYPGRRPGIIPIISVKPGQKINFVVTSESWLGVYTHYLCDRTQPCKGSELDCEGCYQRISRRWKAYLCGCILGNGRNVIIELTQGAMESCPGLIGAGINLRGMMLTLWRRGNARNAPVHARLENPQRDFQCGPPFDLRAALCRVWGLNERDVGQLGDNPPLH